MRTLRVVVATVVLGFMAAPTVSAQEQQSGSSNASRVIVGTRVRVTSTALEHLSWRHWRRKGVPGVVTAIDDSSLTLAGEKAVVTVPLSSIKKLETSRGKKRNTLKGFALGMTFGFIAASVYSLATFDLTPCEYREQSCSAQAWTAGALLVGGGAIGTTLGARTKTERWGKVSLNTAPAVSGGQLPSAVALTVRF